MRRMARWTSLIPSPLVLLRGLPRLAIALLVASVIHEYFLHGQRDPYRCNGLTGEGTWRSRSRFYSSQDAFASWRPSSCLAHTYKQPDIEECLTGRRLVFVGDSTVRQLYWAAYRRLGEAIAEQAVQDFAISPDRQVDLSVNASNVQLDFIFDPWLNSTSFFGQLSRFRSRPGDSARETLAKQENRDSPAIVVVGTPGLWAARNAKANYLKVFREGINMVLHYLQDNVADSILLPEQAGPSAYHELSNLVLLTPVLNPAYEKLSHGRKKTITPKRVDNMNWNIVRSAVLDPSHVLWAFRSMMEGNDDAYMEDGIHVLDSVADSRLDIILNARCNAGLARGSLVNRVTCCAPYPQPSRVQFLLLSLSILGLPWLALDRCQKIFRGFATPGTMSNLIALSSLFVVSAYCFLADRTHLFVKQDKWLDRLGFGICFLILSIICLASLRKASLQSKTESAADSSTFLDRVQSDEWKGWMQAFLLLYNYHGASESLALYKMSRVLFATYLFLSCYGHARYFLRTEDFSFRRVAHVMCRLNALSCLLAYMLNSDWTLYHFCPLVSFWFGVTYLALAPLRSLNHNPMILYLKITTVFVFAVLVIQTRGMLGGTFIAANKALGTSWKAAALQSHLAMDRYVPYFGICTAAVAHRLSIVQRGATGTSAGAPFEKINNAFDRQLLSAVCPGRDAVPIKLMVVVFSAIYLAVFTIPAFAVNFAQDHAAYDVYHPYASPWFVLSAVVLRNCHATLREWRMTAAAALGRLSLELSVLQYHVLLAGNASGIIRIASGVGPGEGGFTKTIRRTEAAMLIPVFVWAAVRCREATSEISRWLTGATENSKHQEERDTTLGSDPESGESAEDDEGSLELQQSQDSLLAPDDGRLETKDEEGGRDDALDSGHGTTKRAFGVMAALWLANMVYGGN